MPKVNTVASKYKKKTSAKEKKQIVLLYPMMTKKYTAVKRAKLRKFEKKLLEGVTIVID